MDPEIPKAVRTRLKAQLSQLGGRVFVTSEDGVKPQEMKFPCVGIRDGGTRYTFHDVERFRLTHEVHLDCYAFNLRDVEAPVIGGAGTDETGTLQLVKDVRTALKGQLLEEEGAVGIEDAFPVSEGGTGLLIGGEDEAVVRKTLTMGYVQLLAL